VTLQGDPPGVPPPLVFISHAGEDTWIASDILVFVLTPNSVDNPWALFELGAAVADNKRVIPIVAKPFDPSETPPLIGRYRFLDESSPTEAARRVAEVVAEPA
jgi:hypothetical protein